MSRRPWHCHEGKRERFREMWLRGDYGADMAAALRVTMTTLMRWRAELDLPRRGPWRCLLRDQAR